MNYSFFNILTSKFFNFSSKRNLFKTSLRFCRKTVSTSNQNKAGMSKKMQNDIIQRAGDLFDQQKKQCLKNSYTYVSGSETN